MIAPEKKKRGDLNLIYLAVNLSRELSLETHLQKANMAQKHNEWYSKVEEKGANRNKGFDT